MVAADQGRTGGAYRARLGRCLRDAGEGGRPDLSLEAFSGAVAHMARAAGGDWKEPDAAMLGRIRAEEAKRIAALKAKK